MGLLRFFLAYVVLLSHCPEGLLPKIFHSSLAVQCFFTISGFYMQLLMTEKYKWQNPSEFYKGFYISRVLRIFPVYLIILFISFIFLNKGNLYVINSSGNIGELFTYISSNLLIDFSLAEFFYYGITDPSDINHATNYNILVQAWSLDLEILFYILTPFILTIKNTKIIFAMILSSILLRFILAFNGYNYTLNHFWTHSFFPTELSTFLLGSLAYRFYYKYKKNIFDMNSNLKKIIVFFVLFASVYLFYKNFGNPLNTNEFKYLGGNWDQGIFGVPNTYWLIILTNALIIPFLFDLSKKSNLDTFIGHLSYPLYICHFSVLLFVQKLNVDEYMISSYTLFFTVILSIILVIFVEKPINKYRHRKFYTVDKFRK